MEVVKVVEPKITLDDRTFEGYAVVVRQMGHTTLVKNAPGEHPMPASWENDEGQIYVPTSWIVEVENGYTK